MSYRRINMMLLCNQGVLAVVGVAMILASTVATINVGSVGGLSVKAARVVALLILLLLPFDWWRPSDRIVLCKWIDLGWFSFAVLIATAPALILDPSLRRLAPALALVVHAVAFGAAFTAFDHLSPANLARVVTVTGFILIAAIVGESVVTVITDGRWTISGDWHHPELLTEEYTWLALLLTLLACSATALRRWLLSVLLVSIILALDTVSAVVILIVALAWAVSNVSEQPYCVS